MSTLRRSLVPVVLSLASFFVSAASAQACGCQVPWIAQIVDGECVLRVPPPSSCSVSVSTSLLEQDGRPTGFRIAFSARNVDLPPATEYLWSTEVICGRHSGMEAMSTVQAAKMGGLKSCTSAGTSGVCDVQLPVAASGSVVLDPAGMTDPQHPSVHTGTIDVLVDCPDCEDSSTCAVSFTIVPDVPGGGALSCSAGNCFEILPCNSFSDCQVPTVEALNPVVCAKSDQVVPVEYLVRRNEFPADRLPLIATVTPANAVDPTDLFGVFPASVELDFDGGTAQEQTFRVGCHSHGPCWQGVSNRLRVRLSDRNGIPVATPTDVQRTEVVVCETPPLRKTLVGQEGDELIYHLTVRNTSFQDVMRDVTVVDRFPNQRILSVEGAIVDWPFDDGLGFVTPLADRLVDADIQVRNSRLEISGLDVAVRDFDDIRLLPDTVVFEVRTRVQGLQLCGEVLVNDGASLTATYLVDDDADGIADREVAVEHETSPVVARCVCPLGKGYWKTHNRLAQSPGSIRDWPIDESTELCGRTWLEILEGNSAPGDAWKILAKHWIASRLNVAEGASSPTEIDEAIAEAQVLLEGCVIDDADRARALELKDQLEAWNEDDSGPGACTELF